MKLKRPIEPKDIVKIESLPGKTGIVNRVDGEAVNIFLTQDNPCSIGIWFNIKELKRIGRVK